MSASEMLRARVEPALAKKVRKWAKKHGTDTSEAIRVALRKLVEEEERARKVEAAVRDVERWKEMGFFDPPKGPWKAAGGFR